MLEPTVEEDPAPILGRDGGLYSDYDKWNRIDAMHVCSENDFPCIKIIGGL